MSTNEKMEKYIEGITPPAYEAMEHRRRLRSQFVAQLATRQLGCAPKRGWRVAILIAGLFCAGALVAQVAVQVQRYFFEGRIADGSYKFSTQPQITRLPHATIVQSRSTSVGPEELGTGSVEQMQTDLEEIDSLRAQDVRELKRVTETQVNGYSLGTIFQFKYVLADGRTKLMNERDSDSPNGNASPAEIEKEQEQIAELRQNGQREVITIIETEVEGLIHRTLICRYVLPDGREVTRGESDPSVSPGTHLSPAQRHELQRLGDLKAGTFVGLVERQLFGSNFRFERYSYKLSDGTVVIRGEGRPTGLKRNLTDADWSELANLSKAGRGELLGVYEQQVRGKLFSFEKKRYILSDGTEVVRLRGVPKAEN